jgi:hypothetical protein
MEPTYKLGELNVEEAKAVTKELQDVLAKHNCEMGVKAALEILKRIPVEEGIPSTDPSVNPLLNGDNNDKSQEAPKAN